ncbi:hypothetical protein G7047_00145 [Diaphorobacter sp. HDW4A]|uniref:hypothetical protein n=1 Tax=Diaphorobacter sp. HDW4A TaxID=2714924 RepID=UPI001407685B|nr:hypothetical protein [Diaphorobacter sp. HDW4A]QIL78504.1 hypothetical protein G7047_00145 [Diaphorobacter sp. HDW4A]
MTEKLTENYSDLFADTKPLESPPEPPAPSPSVSAVAAARPVSFFRWTFEGMRASFLLRPSIALDAVPGPWQLAFLTLIASGLDVLFDRLSLSGEVQFNYQGWLIQWSLCLVTLWLAWCFAPRARLGAAQAACRVIAWFALLTWALLLPMLAYYSVMFWIKIADDSDVPAWVSDFSMSLIASLWMFAVMSKLSRHYFESWLRAFVLVLAVFVVTAVLFATADAETWLAADSEGAPVEVVPGEEESDDGTDEQEESNTPEMLEAQLHVPAWNASPILI